VPKLVCVKDLGQFLRVVTAASVTDNAIGVRLLDKVVVHIRR
jgi:hypothetical protein